MERYVSLDLNRDEFHNLVRLLGHHTCGAGMQTVYERLFNTRRMEATIAENKGPLCRDHPIAARDIYGDRPVVRVE